ncbi:MAG: flagellar biosynthetic protein FliR [Thermoguttaceae bacterium]
MDWIELIDTSRILVFALLLTRVSGIVIMAPVFGGAEIPPQFRALLAFSLSILMMPSQWTLQIAEPSNLTAFAILILAELLIGIALGFGIAIFFTGMTVAGELIGQLGGLSASQIFDPGSGDQVPLLSRMFHYLAVVVFASIGGLRVLIASLLDTCETLPLGVGDYQSSMALSLVSILSLSFSLSIRVAAPVMVAVLVSLLVMGLLGKTLPQLNLMSVGFGINNMVMSIVLCLSIGSGIWCFQERVADVFEILFYGIHVGYPVNS